jgi:DNA invertase Pin-like site-specific DNA recombinase
MLIGYARVSTKDQNLDVQIKALEDAGCEKIYSDKVSGSRSQRVGFDKLLSYLREGDTLVIYKLSRLSRSLSSILNILNDLKERKVDLKVITQNVDTRTPEGKMFLHMIAVFNEFNRELIVENINAGLALSRERGVKPGRPCSMDENKRNMIMAMLKDEEHYPFISSIIKAAGISRATFYRYFKKDLVKSIREK